MSLLGQAPLARAARRARDKVFAGALAASVIALGASAIVLGSAQVANASGGPSLAFVTEPFSGANVQVPSYWTVPAVPSGTNVACLTASLTTTASTAAPIPGCQSPAIDSAGHGALRLTAAQNTKEGGVASTSAVPSSDGLDMHFDTFQYGSNSQADGIMFFLQAANPQSPQPQALGQPGGALAYANTGGSAGMVDGYLGIGFDVYGNYDNTDVGGGGCTIPSFEGHNTLEQNQVSVRGPGSGGNGYCLLSSTKANGGLQGTLGTNGSGTRASSLVPAEVAVNPTGSAFTTSSGLSVPAYSYVVAVTPLGAATQVLSGSLPDDTYVPSSWVDPTTGIPLQLVFGFAGSTGGATDIHEISNVQVAPLGANPPEFGLTLSDSGAGTLVQGAAVTYTATPSLASSTGDEGNPPTVVATFPSGVTPGNATGSGWACATSTQTVTCSYTGSLPLSAGSTLPAISVPATVAGSAGSHQTVSATISESDAVVAQATDTGTVVSSALGAPAFGLTFSDSAAGQLLQGASVTYTASALVSSSGAAEAAPPQFGVTFPAGEAPSAATGTNWSCNTAGQTVTCQWSGTTPIPAGTALDAISLPVMVGTGASGGLAVTGTLSSADASPSTVSVTDYGTVVSIPALGLTLADSAGGDYALGASVVLTATASVLSPGGNEADAPLITDSFPSVFSAVAKDASSANWSCALSGSAGAGFTESCSYTGSLPVAAGTGLQPLVFDNTVKSSGPAAGSAANDAASITSNDATGATATDYARIGASPAPNLSVGATAPPKAAPGHDYVLDITTSVLSGGGQASTAPMFTATLPSGETFASLPGTSGWSFGLSSGNTVLTGTPTTVPISAGTTLTVVAATVAPASAGLATTQITFSDATDGASTVSTSATTNVALPTLVISTNGTPASASAGSSYTVNLVPSMGGSGGPAYNDPVLTTTLPAGESFGYSAPTPSGWNCALSSGNAVLTCTSSASPPIASGTPLGAVSATVDISPAASGLLQTTASLADIPDGATSVQATPSVDVSALPPALGLTTGGTAASALPGGTYTLTLSPSVGASGGVAAHDPVLTVTLPAGETFATPGPAPAGWSCALSGANSTLTCTATVSTPIAPSSALTGISADIDISPTASGTLTTTANFADSADAATPVTLTPFFEVETTSASPVPGTPVISPPAPTPPPSSTPAPAPPGRAGYRLAGADGGVFDFGAAHFRGSCPQTARPCGARLAAPVVAMAATPDGDGYWLAEGNGRVFGFGGARSYGDCSTSAQACDKLAAPVVAVAAAPDGRGYWLAGANGAVFGFGDALPLGSCLSPGSPCTDVGRAIVAIAATPDGHGYWLADATGDVYPFGTARYFGSCRSARSGCSTLTDKIVGIASTPDGQGYWLVGADGSVATFGDAHFFGSIYTANLAHSLRAPISGMAVAPDGQGYWLVGRDGDVFGFHSSHFMGNTYTAKVEARLQGEIVGITACP